nr:helix-turn-helix domain-containing protein [Paracoccaceae bacterium]
LAGHEREWLAAFVFLHDVGKLSPAFQAKAWQQAALNLGGAIHRILTCGESSVTYQLNRGETLMSGDGLKFGAFVRREREAREIGLREMAKKIGVSPTYLSKVERDEFTPPTEDKVRSIAQIIGCDPDKLLAMAGRVPSDLADIIKRHPVEMSALLRTANGLSAEDLARLSREAVKARGE